jgi:cytochrome c biogenesis protein CcmG, thiol:disulfide interchange protein DsbE
MVRKLFFLLPAALFAVLLVAFAMGLGHDPRLLPSAMIDRPAPDFTLPGLDGGAGLARRDLDGKTTLVNFFASWCLPCREEQRELMALSRRPGITLDGIAYKDKIADSRAFLDRFGNPFARIGVDAAGGTAIDFGVYGVPETYLIDRSGHIRYRHVGPLTPQDVATRILPLVARITSAAGSSSATTRAE